MYYINTNSRRFVLFCQMRSRFSYFGSIFQEFNSHASFNLICKLNQLIHCHIFRIFHNYKRNNQTLKIFRRKDMKISKRNYEYNFLSWYAINLAIAFLNLGSLLASLISLINLLQGFVFILLKHITTLFKTFEEVADE